MVVYDFDTQEVVEQVKLLEAYPKVAREEFAEGMRRAIVVLKVDTAARAAIKSGTMATSTTGEIRYAVGDEVRGVLLNEARAADGFPYPYALDASRKFRKQRGRARTFGWFKGSLRRKRRDVNQLFFDALQRTVKRLVRH